MTDNGILIRGAMTEAYWQAARAMCTNCAKGVPAITLKFLDGKTELIHQVSSRVGMVEENCRAAPIRAIIEKLNEGNQ